MNWAMNAACNEIVSLIAKACGTNLPAVRGTSDAAKQIILKFSDDESLGLSLIYISIKLRRRKLRTDEARSSHRREDRPRTVKAQPRRL